MINLEKQVIGGLFVNPGAIEKVSDIIKPEYFLDKKNRVIYQAMLKADAIDIFLIGDLIGDVAYCGEIAKEVVSAANILYYAKQLKEYSARRQLNDIAGQINLDVEEKKDLADIVNDSQQKLDSILHETNPGKDRSLLQVIMDTTDSIQSIQDNGFIGCKTGFENIDVFICGLEKQGYYVIAGRPSMGKTSLAMNIATNVAEKEKVLVFSLEMSSESLMMRIIADKANLPLQKIRKGNLSDYDWQSITNATTKLQEKDNIVIDDRGGITMAQIESKVRKESAKGNLGLVVIDYLQLINQNAENRTQEISKISASVKAIGKKYDVPMVVLSQLNRGLEQRQDKRPVMSDLRDSGSIEQDADTIIMVYRDEVYNEDTHLHGIAEANIVKQRNGPLGKAHLTFHSAFTRFIDFTGEVPAMPYKNSKVKAFSYAEIKQGH